MEGRLLDEEVEDFPVSGTDLFANYGYVDGLRGDVDTIDSLSDHVELSIVLVASGAAELQLSEARARTGDYFHDSTSGPFETLRHDHCET